jgi:CubicO group peptidase (beta-lactamase class C family)
MYLRLLLPIALLAAAVSTSGCSTYLGRFVSLRTPDVEDYRKLPNRRIENAAGATAMPEALDPEWMRTTPFAHAGTRIDRSGELDTLLRDNGTTAFIVVANGRVIDERYYHGYRRDSLFKCFSISKSVLSALFGIAQAEGRIDASERLDHYLSGIDDATLAGMRLEFLLDNVSGFQYARGFAPWKQQPRMYYTTDVRGYVTKPAFAHAPGARFAAEDLSPLLIGVALEAALKQSGTDSTLSDYASKRLWQPMGAEYPAQWVLDRADGGIEKTESGLVARAIDFARFGQLYLDRGRANGRQIVPEAWVEASVNAPAEGSPNRFVEGFHRKLWWGSFRPGRKQDDFYANGHFGQRIYVSPDKALVIVRMGRDGGDIDWTQLLGAIADGWHADDDSAATAEFENGA